jgi:hypothetical protein
MSTYCTCSPQNQISFGRENKKGKKVEKEKESEKGGEKGTITI